LPFSTPNFSNQSTIGSLLSGGQVVTLKKLSFRRLSDSSHGLTLDLQCAPQARGLPMLKRSACLFVHAGFDPVAIGAEKLKTPWLSPYSIEARKPCIETGSTGFATSAVLMIELQGSNVVASTRAVIVMPTTVGTRATPPERFYVL
jgi:hypothetical protein